jgi:hypothetical protein
LQQDHHQSQYANSTNTFIIFSFFSQRIKTVTVFLEHQEPSSPNQNPRTPELQIQHNLNKIEAILRDLLSNLHHRIVFFAIQVWIHHLQWRICHDHEERFWERRRRNWRKVLNRWRRRRVSPIYFRFNAYQKNQKLSGGSLFEPPFQFR